MRRAPNSIVLLLAVLAVLERASGDELYNVVHEAQVVERVDFGAARTHIHGVHVSETGVERDSSSWSSPSSPHTATHEHDDGTCSEGDSSECAAAPTVHSGNSVVVSFDTFLFDALNVESLPESLTLPLPRLLATATPTSGSDDAAPDSNDAPRDDSGSTSPEYVTLTPKFIQHEGGESSIGGVTSDGGHAHLTFQRDTGRVVGHIALGDGTAYAAEVDGAGASVLRTTSLDNLMCLGYAPAVSDPVGVLDDGDDVGIGARGTSSAVPLYNSKPGARGTIFLDFDGHTVTGTRWNLIGPPNAPNGPHPIIEATPYSRNADLTTFTTTEQGHIRDLYKRVREDYMPFDVTVTTDESVFNLGIPGERVRVLVTNYYEWFPNAGGVAFLNSYWSLTDNICWVFAPQLAKDEKFMGEAASHEVGHTLGLNHDGLGNSAYYGGHPQFQGNSNKVSWSPIMGVGYYTSLSQWSKGEYKGANNKENDYTVMTENFFGVFNFDDDDVGDTPATATTLGLSSTTTAFIGTRSDVDYFAFDATAPGEFTFTATPTAANLIKPSNEPITNLDILMTLYASDGVTQLFTRNPDTDTNANVVYETIAPMDFIYVAIEGTGRDDVDVNVNTVGQPLGYSDYGSLGEYSLTTSFVEGEWSDPSYCGDGVVDAGEECDNGPHVAGDCCSFYCTIEPATYPCRPAAGGCDEVEYCDGVSDTCDALDGYKSLGYECRPAVDNCDTAETCSGLTPACPNDEVVAEGTECRAAGGDCDVAESCTGTSGYCPPNVVLNSTVECRGSSGDCDPAEYCTGNSTSCPDDSLSDANTVCRPSAGGCDPAETCTGTDTDCPSDTLYDAGTVCDPAAGTCEFNATCDGGSATCPAKELKSNGTECRAAAGMCDTAEYCTGSDPACPSDSFEPSTVECRASEGPCDPAENCTGASAYCPNDGYSLPGTVCRPAADLCDAEEVCNGTSVTCPPDVIQPNGTACRGGLCEGFSNCDGVSIVCPGGEIIASDTVCRPAVDDCDSAEYCTGDSEFCPPDDYASAGATCDDGDECTLEDVCDGSGGCAGEYDESACDVGAVDGSGDDDKKPALSIYATVGLSAGLILLLLVILPIVLFFYVIPALRDGGSSSGDGSVEVGKPHRQGAAWVQGEEVRSSGRGGSTGGGGGGGNSGGRPGRRQRRASSSVEGGGGGAGGGDASGSRGVSGIVFEDSELSTSSSSSAS